MLTAWRSSVSPEASRKNKSAIITTRPVTKLTAPPRNIPVRLGPCTATCTGWACPSSGSPWARFSTFCAGLLHLGDRLPQRLELAAHLDQRERQLVEPIGGGAGEAVRGAGHARHQRQQHQRRAEPFGQPQIFPQAAHHWCQQQIEQHGERDRDQHRLGEIERIEQREHEQTGQRARAHPDPRQLAFGHRRRSGSGLLPARQRMACPGDRPVPGCRQRDRSHARGRGLGGTDFPRRRRALYRAGSSVGGRSKFPGQPACASIADSGGVSSDSPGTDLGFGKSVPRRAVRARESQARSLGSGHRGRLVAGPAAATASGRARTVS